MRRLLSIFALALLFTLPTVAEDVDELFETGVKFLQKKEYQSALEYLARAHDLAPDEPGIVFNLGFAANLSGNYERGVSAFLRYRELMPQDSRGLTKLIQSYQGLGLEEKAVSVIDELRSWWKAGRLAETPMEKERSFVREIYQEGQYQVMVFEFFEPDLAAREHTWDFCVLDSNGRQVAMYYVMFDLVATEHITAESGNTPVFFNVRWTEGGRSLVGMTERPPTYTEAVSVVRRAMKGEKVGPVISLP